VRISDDGARIEKIIRIGSFMALICDSDTFFMARDTTGF
jgi:hypothetical protein